MNCPVYFFPVYYNIACSKESITRLGTSLVKKRKQKGDFPAWEVHCKKSMRKMLRDISDLEFTTELSMWQSVRLFKIQISCNRFFCTSRRKIRH